MQYDAFELGIITADEFTNAEILEVTYPTVKYRLLQDMVEDPSRELPLCIVTGFLGKVWIIGCFDAGL